MFENFIKNQNKNSEYIPLSEAGQILNTSRDYVNVLVRRGKLRAIKLGRNWVTTNEWLNEYKNPSDLNIGVKDLEKAEKEEFRNLKSNLILEREKALEAKALIPEIKLSSRELHAEEKKNILEAVQNRFKKIDVSEFEKASRRWGILKSLRRRSGLKLATASLVIVLLTAISFASLNISTFKNLKTSELQANILSDVFKNFPGDLPLFYRWLSDNISNSFAFLKSKTPSELVIGELPKGEPKIIKPQEAPPRVDTFDDALALDTGAGLSAEALAKTEGEAGGAPVSASRFTLIENRLSVVEANLKEQKALTGAELSLQKKTILGTLETLIGISKLLPTYPVSTIVVQGQPATLTSFSVAPQVQTGFDRLSADYFTLAHDATINGHLTVKSGADFNAISVSGAATLTGGVTIGGALSVAGDTTLNTLTLKGSFSVSNGTLTNASTTYLTVSNTGWINKLAVTSTATTGGNVGIATTTVTSALTVQGDQFLYGGLGVGIATTTRGAIQTSGDVFVGRNLSVAGNSTTIGQSSSDTLIINSSVGSNLIPTLNNFYNLGSPSFYWGNLYVETVNANNISGASTTISGTKSNDFTINTDNNSIDSENMNLIFFRGQVPPNAVIGWNAATSSKRFEFNQAARFFNESASTTNPTLTVQGVTSQTANVFQVLDVATSTVLFSVNPVSQKTTIINASTTLATLSAFWSTAGQITNASTTNLTVSGNLFAGSSGVFMLADGSVSNPALAFANDTDTGLFRPGNNQMSFATGATTSLMLDNGKVIVGNDILTATYQLEVADRDANSNTIVDELRLSHFTTGAANNGLGTSLLFYGQDAEGAGQNLARIASQVEQATSSNGFLSNLSFWTVGTGGLLEKMRLTGSGALGLATTTFPNGYGFNVATNTQIFGKLNVGTGTLQLMSGNITNDSGNFNLVNSSNNALTFSTNNSERVRIDNNGNFGIGTTSPGSLFSVNSSGNVYFGGALTVSGNSLFNNATTTGLTVNGGTSLGSLAASNAVFTAATTSALTVTGGASFNSITLSATSTMNGFNLCTSANGICASNLTGTTGQIAYFSGTNTAIGTSTIFIATSGNVGIGTTTPSNLLSISGATTPSIGLNVNSSTGNWVMGIDTADANKFKIASSMAVGTNTRLTIDSAGKVGIGTTVFGNPLTVQTSDGGTYAAFFNSTAATNASGIAVNGSSYILGNVGIGTTAPGAQLDLSTDSARKLTTTTWTTGSDIRIKTNVSTISDALDIIGRVRPVKFNYTPTFLAAHPSVKDTFYYNFIAQEYQQVFPDSVSTSTDGLLYLNSSNMIPYAIAGIKELASTTIALQNQINALNQSLVQATSTLQASQGAINLTSLTSDLNLNGFSILNVKSITGINGLWKIDEGGNLIVQSIDTQKLTVGGGIASGVTIYDRTTSAPKCIYIEGGAIKTSDGACGATTNAGTAAVIISASAPIVATTTTAVTSISLTATATATPTLTPVATTTGPILTATSTPIIATTTEPVIVSTTTIITATTTP